MNIRTLTMNAVVATLYVVITAAVAPFGFLGIQFRISELFNHFIVFNKKFLYGIILGVFLANLLFSPSKADVFFGVAHTGLSIVITLLIARFIKNKVTLMIINSIVFSFNMYIIAFLLRVYVGEPQSFGFLWLTLGISELITMLVAIPIVYYIGKQISLKNILPNN